jgi:hypothetical protein
VFVIVLILMHLLFINNVTSHLSLPCLSIGLCLSHLTLFGKLGTLLNGICGKDFIVSILLKLFPIIAYGLLLSDDPHLFRAIKSIISDLSLEREVLDLKQIYIIHLYKIFK